MAPAWNLFSGFGMQLTSVGTGKMFNYLILSILLQKDPFKKNFKNNGYAEVNLISKSLSKFMDEEKIKH